MSTDAPSRIVDAHTHAFPPEWTADRTRVLARDRWFRDLHEHPAAKMVDAGTLLDAMNAANVGHAVMCGWPWRDAGLCREHNDYLAEAGAASKGRLSWLGIVSPADTGASAEAERCLTLGASGIGELNADAQQFDIVKPGILHDVSAVLLEADLPLLLHASEPVGHAYPGKGTATPEKLIAFLASHPDLRVVLAHWGGGLPFYELMPEVAEQTRNVVYDTAASTYLYQPSIFRTVIDIVGPDRVLWGSDHPVLGMGRFLKRTLRDAAVRETEKASVLGGNARRVYKLTDTVTNAAP